MDLKHGRSQDDKKNGQKWVEHNYDAKKIAREANDGVLPSTPALETSDHELSRDWSPENLPIILFYLTPPTSEFADDPVEYLYEENGDVARSEEGNKIRDFAILPRYISIEVEGWMIEAWRRLDSRITYRDILDRQRTDSDFGGGIGLKKLSSNALQNHCRRDCRKVLSLWNEYGRRDEPHRTEVETIEKISYLHVTYNTILNVSRDFPSRLVKVAFKRQINGGLYHLEEVQVTSANVRDTTIDILHFTRVTLPTLSEDNYLTPSMDAAWQMSLLLMERARKHGKSHWSKLEKQCLPVTWYDRCAQGKRTTANSTYDGGCSVCTWEASPEYAEDASKPLITRRKRGRVQSESNREKLLVKKQKRKRSQVAKPEPVTDIDSEDEEAIDDKSHWNGPNWTPTGRKIPSTPIQPRRPWHAAFRDEDHEEEEEEYDAELEDCGEVNNAIQAALSSGGHTPETSGGAEPGACYQYTPSYSGIFDSPLAVYSSGPPYSYSSILYQLVLGKDAAITFSQPEWEAFDIANGAMKAASELTPQYPDHTVELVRYPGCRDPSQVSFTSSTSTYLDHSFSSGQLDTDTTTSFESGSEMSRSPSALQVASARMQQMMKHGSLSNYYSCLAHPGRMNAQGDPLTAVMSSPLARKSNNLDLTSYAYQPYDMFVTGSSKPGFNSYLPELPYDQLGAADVHWTSGDLDYVGDHLALPDANQFIEDDYNELPDPPALPEPTQSESKGNSFLDLMSSEPIIPDEYRHLIAPRMIDANDGKGIPSEYGSLDQGSNMDQDTLRVQTPPLLEY